MTALDVINNLRTNVYLLDAELKYCYVNQDKVPYNGPCLARPNNCEDFLFFDDLDLTYAEKYAGLGISIQASHICAIDVDHCFASPFDLTSADDRAMDILRIFEDTYVEFSFSGTGMRIFFTASPIANYSTRFYIKNSKTQCEYYFPEGSFRYVTVTGRIINPKPLFYYSFEGLEPFLVKYMLRPQRSEIGTNFEPIQGDIKSIVRHYLRSDKSFQDNWFDKAPGFGSNESERDFFLVEFIFEHITRNKEQIKEIFESSPFFKSKDWRHQLKWKRNEFRYFEYLYQVISGGEQ